MNKSTETKQAAAPVIESVPAQTLQPTCPPPGGGSWRWDGAAWQPNVAPIIEPIEEQAAKDTNAAP